jgi:hypothetical protein
MVDISQVRLSSQQATKPPKPASLQANQVSKTHSLNNQQHSFETQDFICIQKYLRFRSLKRLKHQSHTTCSNVSQNRRRYNLHSTNSLRLAKGYGHWH